MASDEDNFCAENNLPTSKIGGLIARVNKMLKKPVIDYDLNETLDSFLNQLNENQQYLSNGIFNMRFAEAGLFLQSSAALYSKKVDILWDNALEYQMQLCSYNNRSEENTEESMVLAQRMNKRQRKTLLDRNRNSHLNENLSNIVDRSLKVLEWDDPTLYYEELKSRWKTLNPKRRINKSSDCEMASSEISSSQDSYIQLPNSPASSDQTQREQYKSCICDIYFPINLNVDDAETGEKLGNYGNMYLNSAVPLLEAYEYNDNASMYIDNIDESIDNYRSDSLLQTYLKQRSLTYKMLWSQELGDNFETFRQAHLQQVCGVEADNNLLGNEGDAMTSTKDSVVNVTRLPNELMAEYLKHNDLHVRTLIKDLVSQEKQSEDVTITHPVAHPIKKGSERISNADSMFHEGSFVDEEPEQREVSSLSQRSNTDSGIFCSVNQNIEADSGIFSASEVQDPNHTAVDSGIFGPVSENGDDATGCDVQEEIQSSVAATTDIQQQESVEESTNPSTNNEVTELPPFLPMHSICIIKPKIQKESLKRKKEVNPEDKKRKRRKISYRWLKTTITSLREFEKFFLQHYEPEFGEADEDRVLPEDYDSDDDTNSVYSVLVLPEDLNEEIGDVVVDSTEISTNDDDQRIQEKNNEVDQENDFDSILRNDEHDQEVPDSSVAQADDSANDLEETTSDREEVQPNTLAGILRKKTVDTEGLERLKTVNEWRKFIEPKLVDAEKNSKFDIHEYGTKIMDAIPTNENLNFKNLAQGKSASEVTRLFLASLQLANTYNVELVAPAQGELANDKLELKLLTRERYHEHLIEYEAPSENSFRERLARMQALQPSTSFQSTPQASCSHTFNRTAKRQRLSYM